MTEYECIHKDVITSKKARDDIKSVIDSLRTRFSVWKDIYDPIRKGFLNKIVYKNINIKRIIIHEGGLYE
ncbi:MAG: hypothetical protein Ta2B_07050 [Termitinemataceae bacterium]|nr:MAG: hypothetical protein Ta2B_07050 [Termitinemataceae bacterium]